jgi:hypothetical protein
MSKSHPKLELKLTTENNDSINILAVQGHIGSPHS